MPGQDILSYAYAHDQAQDQALQYIAPEVPHPIQ